MFILTLENMILQLQNTSMGSLYGVTDTETIEIYDQIVMTFLGTETAFNWWVRVAENYGSVIRGVVDGAYKRNRMSGRGV
jgi:hypothetical protein